MSSLRMAVIGHVEWVQFARVGHLPASGEVVHGEYRMEEPAGGGAVAAVQLARLAGECLLITALGEDELGHRSVARLGELGVRVASSFGAPITRRAVTLVDPAGERAIITLGERLQPLGSDAELPWRELSQMDAVYFTAGDLAAITAARAASVLLATPRAREALGHGVRLDALVMSADDRIERTAAVPAEGEAELIVLTEGQRGGSYRSAHAHGRWSALPAPGPPQDSYGCGDSFAAGLTYGLGKGLQLQDALTLAARCGAYCLSGEGPYEHQLSSAEL
jgi:ribokinase